MPEGRKRFERAMGDALDKKKDKPRLFKGLMGAYVNGVKTATVGDRPDFVYVRLRGATGEVIQAFNDSVGLAFDLPVLVIRDERFPNIWRIEGRDLGQYSDWGGASYLPPHGRAHSFVGGADTGSDPVWVFKPQYMPFLPRPSNTGTNAIYVEAEYYYWEGAYHYFPGSGTADLFQYKPTGGGAGRFVTVYLDGNTGNLDYLVGPEFSLIFPPADQLDFILTPDANEGIPIAAVSLQTGTENIGWNEIYDLRIVATPLPNTGSLTHIYDEGVSKGQVSSLDFVGPVVEAIVSGSYAWISITGSTGGGTPGGETGTATYSLVAIPEPVDSITGQYWRTPGGRPYATGSMNPFIDGISQVKATAFEEHFPESGTYRYLEAPPTGVFHEIKFGVSVTAVGSVGPAGPAGPEGATGAAGAQGPPGTFGVGVTDEGVFLGTGTVLDFVGENVDATISGSVVRVFVTGSIGGGAGGGSGSIVLYDEGTILGSIENLVATGGAVEATISGTFGYLYVTGTVGAQGPEGATGSVGPAGAEGATGSAGPTGAEGATGSTGLTGAEGATGSVGPAGAEGATGTAGPQGIEGATGSVGPAGAEGATGSTGPAGPEGPPGTGQFGVMVLDEGLVLGTGTYLDFVGTGVDASISGSHVQISIPGAAGPGVDQIGVYVTDEGVPVGTGTTLDFTGDEITATISGTVVNVDVVISVPLTGTVVLYDEDSLLGSVEKIVVEGDPAYAAVSGAFGFVSFSGSVGPQGPEGATGSTGPQGAEGATGSTGPQGAEGATGSQGPQGIEGATGSTGAQGPEGATGSVGPQGAEGATGSTGATGAEGATGSQGPQGDQGPVGTGQFGVTVLDEGVILGTGTHLNYLGAGVVATISGSYVDITIPGGGGAGGLGVMVWDEGVPQQTGTILDFVGEGVTATISGTVAQISIPGGGGTTGTSTFVRAGQAVPFFSPTGQFWRIPEGAYETGTLSVAVNGVFQTPVIDFSEQHAISGTFQLTEALETGTILSVIWGVEIEIAGVAGREGATGAAGAQGEEGATGSVGPAGPEGATGSVGPAGAEGATGSVGPAGPEGATGSQGIQGIEGATGSIGPAGPEGATGSVGPQGAEGATGAAGVANIIEVQVFS